MDINDPKEWKDISIENSRTYHYPNGFKYTIHEPLHLNIQKSSQGGLAHRVKTAKGGHYIAPGFMCISWVADGGGFKF